MIVHIHYYIHVLGICYPSNKVFCVESVKSSVKVNHFANIKPTVGCFSVFRANEPLCNRAKSPIRLLYVWNIFVISLAPSAHGK